MSAPVLVTGGAGFIGSHVVDRLLAAGRRPRILDVRASPWHEAADAELVLGDIRRAEDVAMAMRGCSAVCHLAAAADVGEVQADPAWATELNAMGTLNVLEAARRHGVERVVYASTVWVYSDVPGDVLDEEALLAPPAHLYTASKLSGELFCRSYAELYGLQPTILRFGIPYGPRARPAAVIPSFVRRALDGAPLTIAGTGAQERSFVYVEDLAEGVVRALTPRAAGRTYNLGGTETTTIRGLAEVVQAQVADVPIVHTEGRAADLHGATILSVRAERELGWTASTSLAEGVGRYVTWLRAQPQNGAVPSPAPLARRSAEIARRPRAALSRLGFVAREPAVAGVVALIAVLSCLLTLWGAATGNEQRDAVTMVGIAALLPLTTLTLAHWPAELRRAQATVVAALAALVIVVLGLAGTHTVAMLGHEHARWLLLTSAALATTLGVVPHRLAPRGS